jgi:hypothetical protein
MTASTKLVLGSKREKKKEGSERAQYQAQEKERKKIG